MFEIVDVPEKTSKAPIYTGDVEAIDETGKAGRVVFPTAELKKEIGRLHRAAKYLDRGIRIISSDEVEDGDTAVVFIVRDRTERARTVEADEA